MISWLFSTLLASSTALAAPPEVLECTVAFSLKPESPLEVSVSKDKTQNVRVIHSVRAPNNRWIYLIRLLGSSVRQFSSEIQFESAEVNPILFHLKAESGRSFGDVQLFNLEWSTRRNDSAERSARAELVAQPSPQELNSYASLSGNLGYENTDVQSYEINCGTVGWNFGGNSTTSTR